MRTNIKKTNASNLLMPVIYDKNLNPYYVNRYQTKLEQNVTMVTNFFLKSDDWSFEREWRIVSLTPADSGKEDKNYCDVPIKAIYFGIYTSDTVKKLVKDCIEAKKLEIELYEMKREVTGLKEYAYK